MQLYGHFRPRAPLAAPQALVFPVQPGWASSLLAVVVLELGGWWLSHALFRRYVREYFLAHPPDLESDMKLARELGELFSIPSEGDDSVQAYLLRIRQRIGIVGPSVPAPPRRAARAFEDVEAEEEFGLSS